LFAEGARRVLSCLILRYSVDLIACSLMRCRNKLGARRFRERRKEYITTLEERIAGRDGLITETRSQLVRSIDLVRKRESLSFF